MFDARARSARRGGSPSGGTNVLVMVSRPTPQRSPTLDALVHRHGVALRVLYHYSDDLGRGWGPSNVRHDHRFLPKSQLKAAAAAANEVWRRRPETMVVYGYHRLAAICAVVVARAVGADLVTRSDSNWLDEADRPASRRRAKSMFLRCLFGPSTTVWTIGSRSDEYWRNMGFLRRVLIPYEAPNPPLATPTGREEIRATLGDPSFVFLYVGRLEPYKGPRDVVAAFRRLQQRRSRPDERISLLVVGAGTQADELRHAAAADPSVVFTGAVEQQRLGDYYVAADALIVPSHHEAWGLVVNEALSNGLRVVASHRVGSADDLLTSATGRRFRAGDIDELTDAMEAELLAGPSRAQPRQPSDTASQFAAALRTKDGKR